VFRLWNRSSSSGRTLESTRSVWIAIFRSSSVSSASAHTSQRTLCKLLFLDRPLLIRLLLVLHREYTLSSLHRIIKTYTQSYSSEMSDILSDFNQTWSLYNVLCTVNTQQYISTVMWPDFIYNITVLIYCCVLTVYNTLYKFVTTKLCQKLEVS